MVLPPLVLLGSVMHVCLRAGLRRGMRCPTCHPALPLVIRGSLRRVARMREKTVHAGIYYGWVVTATTCVMAFLAMGGGSGLGSLCCP